VEAQEKFLIWGFLLVCMPDPFGVVKSDTAAFASESGLGVWGAGLDSPVVRSFRLRW
jgi:hypothetical protein